MSFPTKYCSVWIVATAFLVLAFSGCGGGPGLLDWGVNQSFPHLRVDIGETQWISANQVKFRAIEIRNRSNGRLLVSIEELDASFDYSSVFSSRFREIIIKNPVLRISPDFLDALTKLRPAGATAGTPRTWTVDRVLCEFGEITSGGVPFPGLFGTARFAFDWQNFSNVGPGFLEERELVVWSVAASKRNDFRDPFASLDLVRATFSLRSLMEKQAFRAVEVSGGTFRADGADLELIKSRESGEEPATPLPTPADPVLTPLLGELAIRDMIIDLKQPAPGVGTGFTFTLNTTLRNLPLNGVLDALGSDVQEIELANIEILSPLDPLVRVISLHSIFVYFTIEGVLQKRIQRLIVLSPTLYLSEDFFLYMKSMREAFGEEDATPGKPGNTGWVVEQLRVEYGRLVLGGERQGQIGLPLAFQTTADNVVFDNLASLRIETALSVEPQDFGLPALQLELEKLRGDLRLSYPPGTSPDNLVNELYLSKITWRRFSATKLWLSATFDTAGVNASLGGNAYGGYVNAGLSYSFGPQNRWIGWVAGTKVNLKLLTDVMFPQNLRLTGPADFTVEVDARSSLVDRVKGSLKSPGPGTMKITKIDEILAELPPEWSSLKRSGSVAALETLRDFTYTSADAEFWFIENQGKLTLRLPGERGSRNLELYLHADKSPDGHWKKNRNPEKAVDETP